MRHKIIKKLLVCSLFAISSLTIPVTLTSCGNKNQQTSYVDYVSKTKIHHENWKETNFIKDGTGIVTLKTCVDGDTAHFLDGTNLIQGRFNGIDTPESTGILEKWGKQASNFTKEILTKAKTIVLESEPNKESEGQKGPFQDTNGRYLVWVWASERAPEEEDGSQLYLVNLQLVQEGFSSQKSASGSTYSDAIYDADLQAQRLKKHIYSNDVDPLFYEGDALTNELDIFQHPENYVGKKVNVSGIVTRIVGTNAYFQKTFYDPETDNEIGTYGFYIFTQYKKYDILKKGNEINVTGTIAERYGDYQLINVSYSNVDTLKGVDDMTLISTGNIVEPIKITAEEANTNQYARVLVTITDLVAIGGYGGFTNNYQECMESSTGTEEYCSINSKNSMTIFVSQTVNGKVTEMSIRIDDSTFIKDEFGSKITDYNYFVTKTKDSGKTMNVTGVMGMYESQSGKNTVQLMLVASSDYNIK